MIIIPAFLSKSNRAFLTVCTVALLFSSMIAGFASWGFAFAIVEFVQWLSKR